MKEQDAKETDNCAVSVNKHTGTLAQADGPIPLNITLSISGPTGKKQERPGQKPPGGRAMKQHFPDVANKDTFNPPANNLPGGKVFPENNPIKHREAD